MLLTSKANEEKVESKTKTNANKITPEKPEKAKVVRGQKGRRHKTTFKTNVPQARQL